MKKLFLVILISVFLAKDSVGQTELGYSREVILSLPWVMEYHKTHKYIPALEREWMHVTYNKYHFTYGFSSIGICNALTLESRSFMGDIGLRDFLSMNAVPISTSTYIVYPSDKLNKHFAFIVSTHKGLPHQVVFSYKQIFKTEGTSRIDEYPYEIND